MKKTVTLQIEKIVAGGLGLGRLADGMIVLVPQVLPGEEVTVEIVKRRKGYVEAFLVEVLESSKYRVIPHCPYFAKCGGCDLQHISYDYQVHIKGEILAEELRRNLNIEHFADHVADFTPCATPLNYRQRIRLQVGEFGRLGFYALRSHDVVEIESCPLAHAKLNEALSLLNNSNDAAKILHNGTEVELLLNPTGNKVVIIFVLSRKARPADRRAAERLAVEELLQSIWLQSSGSVSEIFSFGDKQKRDEISFLLPGNLKQLEMRFETGGFCQVNLAQNIKLVETLLRWANLSGRERVLDLYCGMGNFSLPLALQAKEVVGTDLQRSSIRSAERNATANGIGNARFMRADGLQALQSFDGSEQFDLLVLDPPRRGCRDIVAALPELEVAKIIYISCDPATLIRDLNLLYKADFKLTKIKGFDMFPQTHHMETMAMLEACG